ncbi:MAG: acyl--CoA ligase [Desulfobacteraceae bacterium]|nr:acyl--CoA ligase [Desulfobacteraceae bacterium]
MLITEILARNARMYGAHTALVEIDPDAGRQRRMSWKKFDDDANRLAQALISQGILKGDPVLLLLENCLEWLPIYFGILRTGAWASPVNTRFEMDTVLKCAEISAAKALIFSEAFIDEITSAKQLFEQSVESFIFVGPERRTPDFALSYRQIMNTYPPENPVVPLRITDDAALYFSACIEYQAKAVLLNHRNLEHAGYVENHHHQQTHDDNFLCVAPLYYAGAKMHWLGNFMVGAPAVILKATTPQQILRTIAEEQVTIAWLLVPMIMDILFAIDSGEIKLSEYDLRPWRLMHTGTQPVPLKVIKAWQKHFPYQQYDTNYGLAEATGPGCIHLGMENTHKTGAIGIPGFDWEIKIVDDSNHPVPDGEAGELVVSGPGIMKEYYKNQKLTNEVIGDGWLYTGDIVRMDKDGFLWFVGRKKEAIVTGGENICPLEIEDYLKDHGDIERVAVIGIPSLRLGEIAAAVIQPKKNAALTETDIRGYVGSLPRYKQPRKIIFGDIPMDAAGNIDKQKLKQIYIPHRS